MSDPQGCSTAASDGNTITPLHTAVPGRARFRITSLRRNAQLRAALNAELPGSNGIHRVIANEYTGNILVLFEEGNSLAHLTEVLEVTVTAILANGSTHEPLQPAHDASPAAGQSMWARLKTMLTGSEAARAPTTSTASEAPQVSGEAAWHNLPARSVLTRLDTSTESGLCSAVVHDRLAIHGQNILPVPKGRSASAILVDQFRSLPVGLLILAAGVSVITGGFADAVVITAVVVLNAVIGFGTELQAERTIQSLVGGPEPPALATRDGTVERIHAGSLVPGDIVHLSRGWPVPADARLIRTAELTVDESALTGESMPVEKTYKALRSRSVPLPERSNMVYRGTAITGGTGTAVVIATGTRTEIGKVQQLISQSEQPETPLQRQMKVLGRQLVVFTLSVAGLVFVIGIVRGYALVQMVRTAVSLAIAAVPEGLPTVAMVALAHAVRTLQARSVIVRRLAAVETLGSVRVLCFDKTGTLTLNRMTVTTISAGGSTYAVTGGGLTYRHKPVDIADHPDLQKLIEVCALCSEAEVSQSGITETFSGSGTETALLRVASHAGLSVAELRTRYPVREFRHRAHGRNYMLTVHDTTEGGRLIAVKGSPEEVLRLCRFCASGEQARPLRRKDRKHIIAAFEQMAASGLRTLGMAWSTADASGRNLPLTWLGVAGIADPPREGLPELVQEFRAAGIRAVMLTGDHPATAHAIADALALDGNGAYTPPSGDLEGLSPEQWSHAAREAHIFSRVSPAHKLQVIRALQRNGDIVGMTGDGVNDGPALKAADIGIALGESGTHVARGVADIVLKDDSIQSLIPAIVEGRAVYTNLRKAVQYISATNMSEILVTMAALTAGIGQPLNPRQLLWINLISDVFPEIALATDSPDADIMRRPPGDPERMLIGRSEFDRIGAESAIISASALAAYLIAVRRHGIGERAGSTAFLTLTSAQLLHALTVRRQSGTGAQHSQNAMLSGGLATGFLLLIASQLIPGLQTLLGTVRVGLADALVCAAGASASFGLNETVRAVARHASQKS